MNVRAAQRSTQSLLKVHRECFEKILYRNVLSHFRTKFITINETSGYIFCTAK